MLKPGAGYGNGEVMHMNRRFRELDENNKQVHFLVSLLLITASAFLQIFVMKVFMNPCNLISGGFTGIALFASKVGMKFGFNISTSAVILMLNAPVAAFCCKAISKRFVLLSVIQFMMVSFGLSLFNFKPLFYDLTVNIVFGGILWGLSIVMALNAGGSTGGTDFIAQYVSNKLHKSIFDYVFYANCIMYILYGMSVGWIYAAYSIIFQFLSTAVINRNYKRYAKVTMEITCEDPKPIIDVFMHITRHGMSVIEATGGYSGKTFYICKSVVSGFEVQSIIEKIRDKDPHSLVNVYRSMEFYGNFYQKPIE